MAKINNNALPDGTILKHARTEYRIERYLGSGGFGITYLVSGTAKVSGNTMTLKYCIKEHFLSSDCERDHKTLRVTCSKPARERVGDGKKDFLSEAKRLRDKIQHSHIVRVKDVFEAFDTAYYVMEFLDGKSLRNYIKKHGACGEEEAIALMLPIIRAIGYLHDQSITHLDIKPDNIMIVENERGVVSPTLIDFGLSKHYDKKGKPTSTIRVMATSDGYSPVEQYQGIDTFQPTADIYALAATFVYCITGNDPKKSADIRPGEIRRLLKGKVSDTCLTALLNGMKPSQYERTQSVREFMSELCPNEDSENWDVETDNNITDPIFFRKKTNNNSLWSKLKNIIKGQQKPSIPVPMPIPLNMPDSIYLTEVFQDGANIQVHIHGKPFSVSKIWVRTKDRHLYEYTFCFDYSKITDFLRHSKLILDNRHWEKDNIKDNNLAVGSYMKLSFKYNDGNEYVRESGKYSGIKIPDNIDPLVDEIRRMVNSIEPLKYQMRFHEYEKKILDAERITLEARLYCIVNNECVQIENEYFLFNLNEDEKNLLNPFLVRIYRREMTFTVSLNGYFVRTPEDYKKYLNEFKSYLKNVGIINEYNQDKFKIRVLTKEEYEFLQKRNLDIEDDLFLNFPEKLLYINENNQVVIPPGGAQMRLVVIGEINCPYYGFHLPDPKSKEVENKKDIFDSTLTATKEGKVYLITSGYWEHLTIEERSKYNHVRVTVFTDEYSYTFPMNSYPVNSRNDAEFFEKNFLNHINQYSRDNSLGMMGSLIMDEDINNDLLKNRDKLIRTLHYWKSFIPLNDFVHDSEDGEWVFPRENDNVWIPEKDVPKGAETIVLRCWDEKDENIQNQINATTSNEDMDDCLHSFIIASTSKYGTAIIHFDEWRAMTENEKNTCKPKVISFVIGDNRISLSTKEYRGVNRFSVSECIKKSEESFNNIYDDKASCRLMTYEEMSLLYSKFSLIENTYKAWGLKCIDLDQWIEYEGGIRLFNLRTVPIEESACVCPVVNYYGTLFEYGGTK